MGCYSGYDFQSFKTNTIKDSYIFLQGNCF